MKKIILFLLFCTVQFYYSQPSPPPCFKMQYAFLDKNKNDFLKNFDVVATRFKSPVEFTAHQSEFNDNIQVRDIDNIYLYLYIYNRDTNFRDHSDIVKLSIKQKSTGKIMSIFIPGNYISKETKINNLSFVEGNYLYTLNSPDKKYDSIFIMDNHRNYSLTISDLENHRISLEQLNKILTEIYRKE